MKIKRIGFGYTKSLGNYENCKLWLEADLEDWEDPSESLNLLRGQVAQELNLPDQWHNLKSKFARQLAALGKINARLEKAENRWKRYAAFLVAHGVNPDYITIDRPDSIEMEAEASDDEDDSDPYEYYRSI